MMCFRAFFLLGCVAANSLIPSEAVLFGGEKPSAAGKPAVQFSAKIQALSKWSQDRTSELLQATPQERSQKASAFMQELRTKADKLTKQGENGDLVEEIVKEAKRTLTGKDGDDDDSRARRRAVMVRTISLLALAILAAAGASWYLLSGSKTREAQLKRKPLRDEAADEPVDLSFDDDYPFLFTRRGKHLIKRSTRSPPAVSNESSTDKPQEQATSPLLEGVGEQLRKSKTA